MSVVTATRELSEFQRECVGVFVQAARALSLPKSVGQIYGLLYSTPDPVHLDDVVELLQISKGSASQGLKWLREVGAVRMTFTPGDRRDRYEAEVELRRLATGFLRETAEPHLSNGEAHLSRLDVAAESIEAPRIRDFANSRITKLRRWHGFARQLLPLVLKVAQRF